MLGKPNTGGLRYWNSTLGSDTYVRTERNAPLYSCSLHTALGRVFCRSPVLLEKSTHSLSGGTRYPGQGKTVTTEHELSGRVVSDIYKSSCKLLET